jgi:hypothetical protein
MRKNKEQVRDDNILHINEKILKHFEYEKNKIPEYKYIICELLTELKKNKVPYGIENSIINSINNFCSKYNCDLLKDNSTKKQTKVSCSGITYKEYKDIHNLINDIHTYISEIDTNEINYNINVIDILENYKKIINEPNEISFIGKKVDNENKSLIKVLNDFNNTIKSLIDNKSILYSPTIPEKYVGKKESSSMVNVVNKIKQNMKTVIKKQNVSMCSCIKNDENKIEQHIDNNYQIICSKCGTVYNSSFNENATFYDYTRVNMTQKYHYEKKCHFRDTINQYQGKQNKHIPDSVYDSLEKILEAHGLVNVNETDKIKKYEKVSKQHIRTFLKEIEKSKYYEDTQLIYSQITGKSKPDISKYEKVLYEDFDKLVKVFISLKNSSCERKNFLNSHYVLRQLLLKQGVRVSHDDLNTLKTQSRLREHDEIYKQCCEILNWKFNPMC